MSTDTAALEIVAALGRALAYPFVAPDYSYVFADGEAVTADAARLTDLAAGRTAVIACGSNRAPEQLARKFAGRAVRIPVVRARLRDHDVVYSAHITSYGSVAATLCPAPGTTVAISVLWLDEGSLARMHETESLGVNYDFVALDGAVVETEPALEVGRPHVYASRHGCLGVDGEAVALAEIEAVCRRLPARDQRAIQRLIHEWLAPDEPFARFVAGNIRDPGLRRARIERLRSGARPLHFGR